MRKVKSFKYFEQKSIHSETLSQRYEIQEYMLFIDTITLWTRSGVQINTASANFSLSTIFCQSI